MEKKKKKKVQSGEPRLGFQVQSWWREKIPRGSGNALFHLELILFLVCLFLKS